jgi:hypothetical protein
MYEEVREFLENTGNLSITEFSLYSLGIILTRLNKNEVFEDFLSDTLEAGTINRIRLDIADLKHSFEMIREFELDFDDAYQYVAADLNHLEIVSFDSGFDRTERGRKTPSVVLKTIEKPDQE